MSSGGSPPPESLDASGLPIPDGGGSTSVLTGWHPFKVLLIASNECSMGASSSDGGGGVGGVGGGDGVGGMGGTRDDAPWPRPLRVLAIWYDLTCITQSY
jgi:hypothetical protein